MSGNENEEVPNSMDEGTTIVKTPERLKILKENFLHQKSKRKERRESSEAEFESISKRIFCDREENLSMLKDRIIALEAEIIEYQKEQEEKDKLIMNLIEITEALDGEKTQVLSKIDHHIEFTNKDIITRNEKNVKLEEDIKALTSRLAMLEGNGSSGLANNFNWGSVGSSNDKPIPKPNEQLDVFISLMVDQEERARRCKNLIVFGINESKKSSIEDKYADDEEAIDRLFDTIGADKHKIKTIKRFRSKEGSNYPAPILIVLPDERDKKAVLAAAKWLKNNERYKNVYINPDLTEAERKLDKDAKKKMLKK